MTAQQAYEEMTKKEKIKTINFYANIGNITKEPLKDGQLQELNAIVGILQILYDSNLGSPISDPTYDALQEELIDLGIPRTTSSVEINDATKISHRHTNLRGSLDKVYYLKDTSRRTNKSRKSLDEWLLRAQKLYKENTGQEIDLSHAKILVQPKFDGVSVVEEIEKRPVWITRGDTRRNKASDVTKIMNIFNDIHAHEPEGSAIKFEAMMTEDNLATINSLYRGKHYKNSRQVVISIFNSNEADFKAEYLYPVPLRIMHPGDEIEQIHPDLLSHFPSLICTFADRDLIRDFALENKYVIYQGMRFRTDGAVMTIMDPKIQKGLGRKEDINQFEVAYKFTEETARTKVRDVEFYVSEFGFITPVLVVNDVILKGNTVNHISLSNRERFDELALCYGDEVKVLYDIIPYVTVDEDCRRMKNGRRIPFIDKCPICHEPLDLNAVQVQCKNRKCACRKIGRVLNYCTSLKIQNIGYSTLSTMYTAGLLDHGIKSLYKFKKKAHAIEDLEGFGKLKTRKMIAEIEAKRRLKDYEFFGSIGIEGLSIKTFQMIFGHIKLQEFLDMLRIKNFDLLRSKLMAIPGMGDSKSDDLVNYFKDPEYYKELKALLKEVTLYPSYGDTPTKGRIVFSGCRPSADLADYLRSHGWDPSDSWSKKAKYLIIPTGEYSSDKVEKAKISGVPVIPVEILSIKELKQHIPDLV